MRAYQLAQFGLDSLSIQEKQLPPLTPYDVRIKVRAVSLNYRDLLLIKGLYNKNLPFPLIPCSDGVGDVIEIGESVTRVQVGERVAASFLQGWLAGEPDEHSARTDLGCSIDGMLAESKVLHEDGLVKIPEYLSYEEAATLPCAALTAWNALIATGKIKAGDTVLTMGTGGVSIFAIQFAKMSGARVIVTSSSDEKLAKLKQFGVTETINYKTNPEWGKAALKLTHGHGVDHIIELGGAATLAQSTRAVRIGGTISLIGILAGGGAEFNPVSILMKHIRLQGIFVGSREMFEAMNKALSLHNIKPVVDKVFSFEEAHQALEFMEAGAHFGKIVIRI